jgi:hypothetical protein
MKSAADTTIDPSWVKGLRVWVKKTFAPKTYHSAEEVLEHIQSLRDVELPRLREYLMFRKGMLPFDKEDPKMRSIIDRLRDKVAEELDSADSALYDVIGSVKWDIATSTPGSYEAEHRSDVAEFWASKPEGAVLASVRERAEEGIAKADAAISGRLLRFVSAWLTKWSDGVPFETYEIPTEYSIGRMKVVFDGGGRAGQRRNPRTMKDYIPYIKDAQSLLERRGLGFLWQGTMYVGCKECGGENPYGKNFGVGGHYEIGKDRVVIFQDPEPGITELILHELGHKYFYRKMSQGDRARFDSYFGEVAAVSDYGSKASAEDFAEVFKHFVSGRDMTRDQIDRFKAFLAGEERGRFASEKKGYDVNSPGVQLALREFPAAVAKLQSFLVPGEPVLSYHLHNAWVRTVTLGQIVANWVLMTRDIRGKERAVTQAVRAMKITRTKDKVSWTRKSLPILRLLVDSLSWKERDTQSEGGGVFKIGPFVVHDAVGLQGPDLQAVQQLVEVAIKELRSSPFAKVLYGDIRVVGNIKRVNTLAWYNFDDDDLFIRPETKFGPGDVRSLIHELGHRFWSKFTSKEMQRQWERHFTAMRYSGPRDIQMPKAGDILDLIIGNPGSHKGPPIVERVFADNVYLEGGGYVKGKQIRKILRDRASFPTEYAATSDTEYFAEAFSLYVLGKLVSPFKEHFERIILEGGPAIPEVEVSKSATHVASACSVAGRYLHE